MVQACQALIDQGRVKIFAVDGRDNESWLNEHASIHDRGRRHQAWESCLIQEVLPFIRSQSSVQNRMIVSGCSGGAFHAANFFFKHPDCCTDLIALSGIYSLEHYKPLHGSYDELVYFNDPLMYLPNLSDSWFLNLYRNNRIIICVGQGAWEHICLDESRKLSAVLKSKNIPHWLDLWGYDVNHDWPWWRKQLPYFLSKILS